MHTKRLLFLWFLILFCGSCRFLLFLRQGGFSYVHFAVIFNIPLYFVLFTTFFCSFLLTWQVWSCLSIVRKNQNQSKQNRLDVEIKLIQLIYIHICIYIQKQTFRKSQRDIKRFSPHQQSTIPCVIISIIDNFNNFIQNPISHL